MNKHARPHKVLTLNKDKLRAIAPSALACVRGGTTSPATEYDVAPTPDEAR